VNRSWPEGQDLFFWHLSSNTTRFMDNPGGGGRAAAVRATVRRLTHEPRTGWREMKTCCPSVAESKEMTTFAMSLADYPVRMP
jgi:hypothetical protein